MSPGEAIEKARLALRRGRLRISFHARHERMELRSASRADIEEAIETCSGAIQHPERKNRWRLTGGVDFDGDGLDVVVAFDDDGITCVVTILSPKEEI